MWRNETPIIMTHAQQLPSFLTYQAKEIALKYHQFHIGRGRHSPNSLSALKEVIAGQARIIEFDIGLLADDGFALLHDDRLERETNGVGPLTLHEAADTFDVGDLRRYQSGDLTPSP